MIQKIIGLYYKIRTLISIKKLQKKYLSPEGHIFFSRITCPLCKIYYRGFSCNGCLLNAEGTSTGCRYFETFARALDEYNNYAHLIYEGYVGPAFEARAMFFELAVPVAKEFPGEVFIPGAPFNKELRKKLERIDQKISNEMES